jgi:acyl-coenzyme A thioesterase PaaI-like protein
MKFAGIRFGEFLRRLVIRGAALVGLLALLCLIAGCGGGGTVTVTILPNSVTVALGAGQTFMATVTGSKNIAVTWTVQEGAAGGSIDNQGNYTAPQVAGTYHVIATSMADPGRSGSATVTVPVAVTVTPNPATVFQGGMQAFMATVTGSANIAVTWTITEGAAGGTIDANGNYIAPMSQGTFHVVATSVADTTQSATATITVPPVTLSVFPTTDTLGPSGLRTFVATVTATNGAVTWTITEGAAGGTIDANGNYIAPMSQGTFHVVATSVADTTLNATATVTVVPSGFLPTGSMTTARSAHTATLLNTGEALVAGGIVRYQRVGIPPSLFCVPVATNHADLFDPGTGTFTATGAMTTPRFSHTATVLKDGINVLVAGGDVGESLGGSAGSAVNTAEIFNPATAAFTATGLMLSPRENHTATLLPSGKVLLAGGQVGGTSAELFDPTMGTFAATGSMSDSRFSHTATLLSTGKVLVIGGVGASDAPVSTAELYDPVAGTFSLTGSMGTARVNHTATLLPSNGTVLIVGGNDPTNAALTSAEIYNPMTGTFTPTGSMQSAHSRHTATLLPSGKVLIAGGGNYIAELFDPGTGTFALTGSMLVSRTSHTATRLPNGQVVITGSSRPVSISNPGGICHGGALASAEVYH